MDTRLVVLKLFLDELGEAFSINSVDDRKRIQKAVYLGQLSGIDLGYRYSWYLMGPYSTSLTRDYYSLANALTAEDHEVNTKSLNQAIRETLRNYRELFNIPNDVNLTKSSWLELLCSYHYLAKVSHLEHDQITTRIQEKKPDLSTYVNQTRARLHENALL